MPTASYTDEELDAAIEQLTDRGAARRHRTSSCARRPSLQRVLAAAMADGGWFDSAHEQAVREAPRYDDPDDADAGSRR